MPVTGLRGRQILDGDVFRNDLNVTSSTQAVVARIVEGTNITIASSNTNMAGTGDVTINAFNTSQNANTFFAAPNGSNGNPSFRALVSADIPTLTLENLPDAWVKRAVRVATTANITLSGTQTIDGISVVAGDRVLVKDQTTTANNGIYIVAAGTWSRSADANISSEIAGAMVAVDLGTTNGGTTWDTDFRSSDTLGTTAMTWFRMVDTGYTIPVLQGGTGATTLTGVLIGAGTSAVTGVTGTASQLLRRNSGNSAYEFFSAGNLTKLDDTNVTLTLGGTPTGSLINAVSLTLGWTGQLAVGRGGSGASTLTGVLIGNGTSAFTGVTGTASQLLRRNAGNTAYEFFTPTYLTANQTITLSGDVTGSGATAITTTIANNVVTFAKMQQIATSSFLGRVTAATGNIENLTGTQATTLLDVFTTTLKGLAPASGGGTTNFLRADGTWAAPSGTSQWTTNGTAIYYNTGRVGINSTTPTNILDVRMPSVTDSAIFQFIPTTATTTGATPLTIHSNDTWQTIFKMTNSSSSSDYQFGPTGSTNTTLGSGHFGIWSGVAGAYRLAILSTGQLRLPSYTTTTSFTGTIVGYLAYTSNGSVVCSTGTGGGGGGITGSGTGGKIALFTGTGASTAIGDSILTQNSTIGVNLVSASEAQLYIQGGGTGYTQGNIMLQTETTGASARGLGLFLFNATNQTMWFAGNGYGAGEADNFYIGRKSSTLAITDAADPSVTAMYFKISNGGNIRINGSTNNGSYIDFSRSSTYTNYGYIGNSSLLFLAGFNGQTELGISSVGAINFGIGASAIARMQTNGQLRLVNYTATTSFNGTPLVGLLGFDASGNILTTTAGGGGSQWTTSGVNIYYTAGGVSIGTTTTSDILHIGRASGNDTFIRFDQLTRTTWRLGQSASTDPFRLINASAGATRLEVLASGQFIFNAYTAFNSFSNTDAQGILGFDTSGNIVSMAAPIYRNVFIDGIAVNATPPANIAFYNSSNAFVTKMDLTGKKRGRIMGRVTSAGIATAVLRVRYALTFSTTASSYLTMGSSEIEISLSATGYFDSGWINLVAGAKADVFVALLTNGGDGADQLAVANATFEAEE